jgi:hypothetical protein
VLRRSNVDADKLLELLENLSNRRSRSGFILGESAPSGIRCQWANRQGARAQGLYVQSAKGATERDRGYGDEPFRCLGAAVRV